MTKPEAVKDAAIQRIGCPYVFGGTGKVCTPQYRQARMSQYPDYADKIRKNCPRLRGSVSSCANCKWCDPETGKGKLCYDCAQLALACMKAADIPLVSGSDSQWRKTVFQVKGEIKDIQRDKVCLVFRNDSDKGIKMGHVGVYLGDGTVVHARGHDFGVMRQELSTVNFTHFGIPSGLYDNGLPTLRRGNSGEYVRLMQQALSDAGFVCDVGGKFGRATEEAVKQFQMANGLTADGICGPKTWAAIGVVPEVPEEPEEPDEPEEPEEPEIPDWVEDEPTETPKGAVTIDREDLTDMLNHIEAMTAHLEAMTTKLNEDARQLRVWLGADA